MRRLPRTVQILRRVEESGARTPVEAEVWAEIHREGLAEIGRTWTLARQSLIERLSSAGVPEDRWPEHFHWDWEWKADVLLGAPGRAAFGLLFEQQWQGWLLTVGAEGGLTTRLPQPGRPIVYVDYLEIAPWNLRIEGIDRVPRFTAVGTRLLQHAVQISLDAGFEGRAGLHSLPQAEPFYERCGMARLGADPAYHGLVYFEFPPQSAGEFMRKQ